MRTAAKLVLGALVFSAPTAGLLGLLLLELYSPFTTPGTETLSFEDGTRAELTVRRSWPGLTGLDEVWLTGPASFWRLEGTLAARGAFVDGERHGPWMFWSDSGELDLEQSGIYDAGARVGSLEGH